MFNSNNMQGISVLSYSLLNSAADVIKSNTFEKMDENNFPFVSQDGDIYFPLETKLKFGSSGGGTEIPTFYEDQNARVKLLDYGEFKDYYIDRNITTVSYDRSLHMPTFLRQLSEKKEIYGVIIEKGDYMLNPLHPLVAFSAMSNLLEIPDKANLHIFEWSKEALDKMDRGASDYNIDFYEKEYKQTFDALSFLIKKPVMQKQKANLREQDIEKILQSPLIEDINSKIDLHLSEGITSSQDIKSILVPTQLAIGNIATPYYGILWLKKPVDGGTGYNMTPMLSGNLNQSSEGIESFNDLISHTGSGNICTGSENSQNHRGWSTLSKVNINSMFNQHIVDSKKVLPFVQASKKISSAIWGAIEKKSLEAIPDEEES